MTGVGLFITIPDSAVGVKDDCVATLDSELLLVGLPGRAGANEDGLAGKPADGCLDVAIADAGMLEDVGVGVGVDWVELAAVLIAEGWCFVVVCTAGVPWWTCPSSPEAKVRQEQKPSEEVIRRVSPSLDLLN